MEYQSRSNEKYMPVLHCILSIEGTSYKKLHNTVNIPFIRCCFTSAFTSAD